jgi:uncharacterized protein DUF4383
MKMDQYLTPELPLSRFYRWGAAVFGAALVAFGAFGVALGLPFVSTSGAEMAGLGTNGLLSVISIVVGAVLVAAALRGGPVASTTMAAVGALFLASGLLNLTVLGTSMNLLAFRWPNVVFSLAVGTVLLLSGTYGRVSGGLAADNPYVRARAARARPSVASSPSAAPSQETIDLIDAETAMFLGHASPAQKALVREDAQQRATGHVRHSSERDAASLAVQRAGRALRPS